jgi:hypothetical protein
MKLNFPASTNLFQIARELAKIGYIISAKQNRDGSHDVFARPTPEQFIQNNLPKVTE